MASSLASADEVPTAATVAATRPGSAFRPVATSASLDAFSSGLVVADPAAVVVLDAFESSPPHPAATRPSAIAVPIATPTTRRRRLYRSTVTPAPFACQARLSAARKVKVVVAGRPCESAPRAWVTPRGQALGRPDVSFSR